MAGTEARKGTDSVREQVVIGERIKSLRERLGLSQDAFAEASGGLLGRIAINKAENGGSKASTTRWAEGIATASGATATQVARYLAGAVSLDELLDPAGSAQLRCAIELARASGVDDEFIGRYREAYKSQNRKVVGFALVIDMLESLRRISSIDGEQSTAGFGIPSVPISHKSTARPDGQLAPQPPEKADSETPMNHIGDKEEAGGGHARVVDRAQAAGDEARSLALRTNGAPSDRPRHVGQPERKRRR